MRNIKFISVLLAFCFILSACGNTFEGYVSKADKEIKNKKYSEAIKDYQEALKLKDDKKIQSKLEQTENLKKAQDAFDKHEIGKAMNHVQKAKKEENIDLTKQANELQEKIQQEFIDTFNKINIKVVTGDAKGARKSLEEFKIWIQQSEVLKSQKDLVDTVLEKEASVSELEKKNP
ncbi:hypothetical protein P7D08_26295 [Bacillus pacificus]|uniref:hypothetical protein n=1 Tax=Bacillus pacificus TaxID=2026187 RepID=UPI00240E4F2F|nr:hypothetical protein [Bacillus pacificus]MDG1651687.1 hypothetical protein [Bacillus pacificus]